MKLTSERTRILDQYLKGNSEIGRWPIEIGGQKQIMPFYRFPIDMLLFNTNNGRIAMEVKEWEEANGREIDSSNQDDADLLHKMLLKLDETNTAALKDDLRRKGQMEPGVITHDGVVINANRRMAILKELHLEDPSGKWQYLEALRLGEGTSPVDLWRIEAGLQLSKDKGADYHPVNELLKIQQGIDSGLEPHEVAAAMYGWKPSAIKEALERLELINNFLDFLGQARKYGVIKKYQLHEAFIDIQKMMAQAKKDGIPSKDRQIRLRYTYALLRASIVSRNSAKKVTHREVRHLKKIFRDEYAKSAFVKRMENSKEVRDIPTEHIIDDFREAVDLIRMRAAKDKPVGLVTTAINALTSIDKSSPHFAQEAVRHKLTELKHMVEVLIAESSL